MKNRVYDSEKPKWLTEALVESGVSYAFRKKCRAAAESARLSLLDSESATSSPQPNVADAYSASPEDCILGEPELRQINREIWHPMADAALSRVFIVHGHDEAAKASVTSFLKALNLNPVALEEQPNMDCQTTIERFLQSSSNVGFAVGLLTGDDANGLSRPNVLVELGFFLGKLGRDHVCLLKGPGVEMPSDLSGMLYIDLDPKGTWQLQLVKEMKLAGLPIEKPTIYDDHKSRTALTLPTSVIQFSVEPKTKANQEKLVGQEDDTTVRVNIDHGEPDEDHFIQLVEARLSTLVIVETYLLPDEIAQIIHMIEDRLDKCSGIEEDSVLRQVLGPLRAVIESADGDHLAIDRLGRATEILSERRRTLITPQQSGAFVSSSIRGATECYLTENELTALKALTGRSLWAREVFDQVNRMLRSRVFGRSEDNVLKRLLAHIVTRTLLGPQHDVSEAEVARMVFGEPNDDPIQNSKVRLAARRVRQDIEQYYAADGKDDPIKITLNPGSYSPQLSDRRATISIQTFENWNPRPEPTHLCSWLSDEISYQLGLLQGLRVIRSEVHVQGGLLFQLRGSLACRGDILFAAVSLGNLSTSQVVSSCVHQRKRDSAIRLAADITETVVSRIQDEIEITLRPQKGEEKKMDKWHEICQHCMRDGGSDGQRYRHSRQDGNDQFDSVLLGCIENHTACGLIRAAGREAVNAYMGNWRSSSEWPGAVKGTPLLGA